MSTSNGAVITQVRQAVEAARQAGQPAPGRPTLVRLTGATDHAVRKAMAKLANESDSSGELETSLRGDNASESKPMGSADSPEAPSGGESTGGLVADTAVPGAIMAPTTSKIGAAGDRRVASPPEPGPPGGRLVAWTGFVFGSVMSIAANVLHAWLPAGHEPLGWSPGVAPQVGAAVWPIGLMLAVEALSRIRWPGGLGWGLARFGGAGAVAVGSAVISYGHLRDVLVAWSYGPLAAAVGPLVLDGLMVVCGFALLAISRSATGESRTRRLLPYAPAVSPTS
jgi:hypothetical protein